MSAVRFDDRLQTVLAQPAANPHDRAVRWRQLVELLARSNDLSTPLAQQALTTSSTEAPRIDRSFAPPPRAQSRDPSFRSLWSSCSRSTRSPCRPRSCASCVPAAFAVEGRPRDSQPGQPPFHPRRSIPICRPGAAAAPGRPAPRVEPVLEPRPEPAPEPPRSRDCGGASSKRSPRSSLPRPSRQSPNPSHFRAAPPRPAGPADRSPRSAKCSRGSRTPAGTPVFGPSRSRAAVLALAGGRGL